MKKTVHQREFIIHIQLYLLPRELLQTLARIFRNNLLCIVFERTQNIRCANSVYGEIIYSSDDTRIIRLDIVSSLPIIRHKRKYFMSMSRVKKRKNIIRPFHDLICILFENIKLYWMMLSSTSNFICIRCGWHLTIIFWNFLSPSYTNNRPWEMNLLFSSLHPKMITRTQLDIIHLKINISYSHQKVASFSLHRVSRYIHM